MKIHRFTTTFNKHVVLRALYTTLQDAHPTGSEAEQNKMVQRFEKEHFSKPGKTYTARELILALRQTFDDPDVQIPVETMNKFIKYLTVECQNDRRQEVEHDLEKGVTSFTDRYAEIPFEQPVHRSN